MNPAVIAQDEESVIILLACAVVSTDTMVIVVNIKLFWVKALLIVQLLS